MPHDLPQPTVALVETEAMAFDTDRDSVVTEAALTLLFSMFPANTSKEHVLLKAAALNALYSTNIYALQELTRLIVEANIDPLLESGSPEAVREISSLTAGGKTRSTYSFATKYCSWHRPEVYPIFDSVVEQALSRYKRKDRFAAFPSDGLRDYETFLSVLAQFRESYGLQNLSLKTIDKFLWRQGRA